MVKYATVLDLAQQRLSAIAASPNFTREAREAALKLQREVAAELELENELTALAARDSYGEAA